MTQMMTESKQAQMIEELASRLKRQSQLIACPVCDSPVESHLPLTDRERYDLPLRSVMCATCGVVMFNPRPTSDYIRFFYREAYHGMHRSSAPDRRVFNAAARRCRRLIRLVDPHLKRNAHVLDVGASSGHLLGILGLMFSDRYPRLEGIEPDPGYAEYANTHHHHGIRVHCTSFEEFEPQKKYDLITMQHTFEHLHDMSETLEKCQVLLADDGLLYIETPNAFEAHIGRTLENWLTISKLYQFTPLVLQRYLAAYGFQLVVMDDEKDKHTGALFRKVDHHSAFAADERVAANAAALIRYFRHTFGVPAQG